MSDTTLVQRKQGFHDKIKQGKTFRYFALMYCFFFVEEADASLRSFHGREKILSFMKVFITYLQVDGSFHVCKR